MKQKDKLKMMTLVGKFFTILTFIMNWYAEAQEDRVIDQAELVGLGTGICGILGLKTEINLDGDDD